ncbi:hypothetical protein [Silvimonas soli]|uniref:hypothetical protein n=1 Tax=Silvimonas soli TaxID=2980100 RepID=UPI0024B337CE|nr:hypothetical protein [Silvimonas soli]
MQRHLVRSYLASSALVLASLILAGVATWRLLALQHAQDEWIEYRQQSQQQPKPVWLSAEDRARLKQLAERGALQPADAKVIEDWVAGAVDGQFEIIHSQFAKPLPAGPVQGAWRLVAVALEFDVWLMHEQALSRFWSRLETLPGWLDVSTCHLTRSTTTDHPSGIVMHCSGEVIGFGPNVPGGALQP